LYFDFQSERWNTLGKKYLKCCREIPVGSPPSFPPQAIVSTHTGLTLFQSIRMANGSITASFCYGGKCYRKEGVSNTFWYI